MPVTHPAEPATPTRRATSWAAAPDEPSVARRAFDRQVQRLLDLGYPALAARSEAAFLDHVLPLRDLLPHDAPGVPFVVVVTGALVPLHELPGRLALGAKQGFTTMEAGDLARFRPTTEVPDAPAYLATGLSAGREHLDRTPDQALPDIVAAGHQPLTLEEGLALATHHPELLRDDCCFSMLGSRCGDRRVTAVWLSKGRPRLGWCYAGAPHTWLGSGWLTGRLAAGRDGRVAAEGSAAG